MSTESDAILPVSDDPIEQRYRDDLIAAFGRLALQGLPETRHDVHDLRLEHVFIRLSLRVVAHRSLDEEVSKAAETRSLELESPKDRGEER